jgi:cell wall-associated NlpC family hydrolase
MLRTVVRSLVAACLALTLAAASAIPAAADPLADKRAQAAAVQAQIGALDTRVSKADEDFNVARDRYDKLSVEVHSSERKVARLTAKTSSLQSTLGRRADEMYRDGGARGTVAMLLSTRSIAEFNAVFDAYVAIGQQDAAIIAQLKSARVEADAQRRVLVTARAKAARQKAAMAASAKAVRVELAARKSLLASIDAAIARLIAEQQTREAAAARARWGSFVDIGGNPPTSSKGAAAVWWAEKALGRPYEWAASGPGSFDCSGLVMWAYSHVGASLPHSSREQINNGARVARANLEPGDLVFFGSPIHHVGMYVGGGAFIEAPHTGAVVRIASLGDRGDYAGACRP